MDLNVVTPESVGFSSTRLSRITAAMRGYVDQGQPPGIITAVARRGKVVHFECLGMMDVEAGKPMQPDTIFRIYSMTKTITSVALMMLFEEGHFALDDPVSRFIPEFQDLKVYVRSTEKGVELTDLDREVTVLDLLTHTSGLGSGLLQDSSVEEMHRAEGIYGPLWVLQASLQQMIEKVTRLPLANQPGADWRYSDTAYDVIGYLIGIISGMPFDTFLGERVFGPLGMDDTGFYVPQAKIDRLAAMYERTEAGDLCLLDAPATSPFASPDLHPSGSGGLVSTAPDYLRFAQMLLNGGELDGIRLLSCETVELMTRNRLPNELVPIHFGPSPWPGMGYGLGFCVHVEAAQAKVSTSEGTFGWVGWDTTKAWVDPREELIHLWFAQCHRSTGPVHATFIDLTYQAIVD